MDAPRTVSIVIPARNEAANLGSIIDECRPHGDEVLVVDGHSTDGTREVALARGARVVLDGGRGKGDGLRTAIEAVTGEAIVFIDADGSHVAADIPMLLGPLREGRADLVIGSRMRGGSDELHGDLGKFIRMVGSAIITLGINYRFGVELTDSQNGFRAIRTALARRLGLREDITTIEQEMLIKCLAHGGRVSEVPSHEYERRNGQSCIVVRRVWFRYVYSWLKYLAFPRS